MKLAVVACSPLLKNSSKGQSILSLTYEFDSPLTSSCWLEEDIAYEIERSVDEKVEGSYFVATENDNFDWDENWGNKLMEVAYGCQA